MNLSLNKYIALGLLLSLCACNDVVEELEYDEDIPTLESDVIPPGEKYYKEGDICLNVFYCIPSDLDTIPEWHRRLSQVTLHTQEYFRNEFKREGYGEKTFNLVRNEKSEDFIKIHLLPIDVESDQVGNISRSIIHKVKDFQKANPDDMAGKYNLVYMPTYTPDSEGNAPFNGAYSNWDFETPIDDMGFAIVAVDRMELDMKYWGTAVASSFLSDLGGIIHELGHCFWLQHNEAPYSENVYACMGQHGIYKYFNQQDSMIMTDSDLKWLNQLDVFKKDKDQNTSTFIQMLFRKLLSLNLRVIAYKLSIALKQTIK